MNPFGNYTVPFADGTYHTYWIRPHSSNGRIIVSRGFTDKTREELGYLWVKTDGKIQFTPGRSWAKDHPEDASSVRADIKVILRGPEKAAMEFASRSGRCSICSKRLTTPASIANRIGPECARKTRWTKNDNAAAFNHLLDAAGPSALKTYLEEMQPEPNFQNDRAQTGEQMSVINTAGPAENGRKSTHNANVNFQCRDDPGAFSGTL